MSKREDNLDKEENIDEYCDRIKEELNNFFILKKQYKDLDVFIEHYEEPDKISITNSKYAGYDEEGIDIYEEILLPDFLEFAKNNGFDILNYSKHQYKENFRVLLDRNIQEFNEEQEPIVFRNYIYFLRYTSKNVSGLPKDEKEKRSFLESKELFDYQYYRIKEEGLLKLMVWYINLYKRYEKSKRLNNIIIPILIILIIALFGMLIMQ